jgi:tubulin polyglutamylase TTLL6/13
LRPYVLEVNQSPSFSTDSPLDYKIKKCVIGDAFHLLNTSYEKRMLHINNKKEEMEKRILTGKTQKFGGEDKEKLR